nr:hypothetical protein [Tanacetum cinerariifolium]
MQTQEDNSNQIQALNIDSLKVDLVVKQHTCFEKEDSNSKTASSKSINESILNSKTKNVHAIKYKMSKAKERCMAYFRSLYSHLQVLSKDELKGTHIEHGFKRAFMSLFGQDVDTFTNTYFLEYTGIEVKHFRDTLLQHMGSVKKSVAERTRHRRQFERRVNKRHMQTQESKNDTGKAVDNGLVVMESNRTESEVQDDNSSSGNDTYADDADIRPIYDEELMAEVQLTVEYNILAIGQHHTEQPEIINEDRVDQYPKTCQVKVTQHYLPKNTESAFVKPDHMIASSSSRNSSKNMLRFSSNDMVHNHYLNEAKKKTQERDMNSKTCVMPSTRFQCTADDSKPKPRRNNKKSRSLPVSKSSRVTITVVPKADHSKSSSSFLDTQQFVCFTCHKCVFNANHDACITKLLKEKTSPRSDLRWKPTGRIFKTIRLRWIPTGKIFNSCMEKVNSELINGSNADIPNIHVCKQTLDLSAVQASNLNVKDHDVCTKWFKPRTTMSTEFHQAAETVTTSNELDLLFDPLSDEYFNGENQVVSKSFAVTTTDASDKRQQQPDSTSSTSTLATSVTA